MRKRCIPKNLRCGSSCLTERGLSEPCWAQLSPRHRSLCSRSSNLLCYPLILRYRVGGRRLQGYAIDWSCLFRVAQQSMFRQIWWLVECFARSCDALSRLRMPGGLSPRRYVVLRKEVSPSCVSPRLAGILGGVRRPIKLHEDIPRDV